MYRPADRTERPKNRVNGQVPAMRQNARQTRENTPETANGRTALLPVVQPTKRASARPEPESLASCNSLTPVSDISSVAVPNEGAYSVLTANPLHTNKYRPVPVASCGAGQELVSDSEVKMLKTAAPKFKRGIYETEYGDAAYVSGPNAKTAKDLDMGERIPISMVTTKRLGDAE